MKEESSPLKDRTSYLEKHLSERQIGMLCELAKKDGVSLWDLLMKSFDCYSFIKSHADRYLSGNVELLKELCGSYFEYFHKKK